MLGDLSAESNSITITHFREPSHSRDEQSQLLWSELEPERAKRNLRQALSSLRHHLAPPGTSAGAVLDAQLSRIRIHPDHVATEQRENSTQNARTTIAFSDYNPAPIQRPVNAEAPLQTPSFLQGILVQGQADTDGVHNKNG